MTNRMHLMAGLAAVALSVAPIGEAGAQRTTRNERECERAARLVARGHPQKKLADAFLALEACGGAASGSVLAEGLKTYAVETNVEVLQEFWHFVDAYRDGAVFAAAKEQALDPAATAQARVFAVRHLLVIAHPFKRWDYAGLVRGEVSGTTADMDTFSFGCGEGMVSEAGDRGGTPLPADVSGQIDAALAALIASPSTPAAVKNAARCK